MREVGLSLCVEDIDAMTVQEVQEAALPVLHRQGLVMHHALWAFRTLWLKAGDRLPESLACDDPSFPHDHILVRASVDRPGVVMPEERNLEWTG